jgi:hypothetical protein
MRRTASRIQHNNPRLGREIRSPHEAKDQQGSNTEAESKRRHNAKMDISDGSGPEKSRTHKLKAEKGAPAAVSDQQISKDLLSGKGDQRVWTIQE